MNCGIYRITNVVNNKVYIGNSRYLNRRWKQHKFHLNNNNHPNRHLQFAWNKDKSYSFDYFILEYCEIEKLLEREQYWIDKYKAFNDKLGYNLSQVAGSPMAGLKHTEETKKKIGAASKGKKLSEAHILRIKEANTGRIFSDEHKKKMSESGKNKIISDEHKKKISLSLIGNDYNRDREKWPCKNGRECKCEDCIIKRKELYNEWHRKWRKERCLKNAHT